jgi:hypothetical protein
MNAAENVFHLLLLLRRESWKMKLHIRNLHGGLASRAFPPLAFPSGLIYISLAFNSYSGLLQGNRAYHLGLTGLTGLHRLTSEFRRRTVSIAKNYPILLQLI